MRLPLLALASAAAATPLSEWASLCVRSQAGQIESVVACGDAASFTDCLNSLSERIPRADLEACLAASGCSEELAAVGAETLVYACEAVEGGGDLRKRQRGGTKADDDEDSSSDSDSDSSSSDSKSDKEDSDSDSKSDPKEKPADDEKDEPKEKAEPEKPAEKTDEAKAKTTAEPEKATTTSKSRPTDSDCYDTTTETTTTCTIVEGEGNKCDPVDVPKKVCREGYYCKVEEQGGTTCMVRVDTLDVGGIIVSIIFGSFIVLAIGLMTFFCCKDRRDQKNLAAKAEAAAIAKASNVGKKARNVSDRQPLMGGPGPSSPGGAPYGGEQPNPFNDQSRY